MSNDEIKAHVIGYLPDTDIRKYIIDILDKQNEEELKNSEKELIYLAALNRYGLSAQIDMVFEEFSELQKELCKYKRGKSNRADIAEEIADCQIMLEQMIQFFGLGKNVEEIKASKIMRLKERLSPPEDSKSE